MCSANTDACTTKAITMAPTDTPKAKRTYFDPTDLALNDYIVVVCPKAEADPCWFEVPGTEGVAVWVARVKECKAVPGGTFKLSGWFMYNETRDLMAELVERSQPEGIDMSQEALVGVYSYEEDFALTAKNVKELARHINSM